MNVYWVESLEEIEMYHEDEINPAEWGRIADIVVAETRGHARSLIVDCYDCEFMEPMSIRLVHKGIDREPGIKTAYTLDDLALHIEAWCKFNNASDIEEWEAWEQSFETDDALIPLEIKAHGQ